MFYLIASLVWFISVEEPINKRCVFGNSLAVQWLGLRALSAGARVQSLVGELKSYKLQGVAKKKKERMYI